MDGKDNGFSLIEALVAMAGLAVTCCIALPALGAASARARDVAIRSAMVRWLPLPMLPEE